MIRSLVILPLKLSARCAALILNSALGVADRALGIAGTLADSLTHEAAPEVDFDGSPRAPAPRGAGPRGAQPDATRASPVQRTPDAPTPIAPDGPASEPPPIPGIDVPRHVSEEPTLIQSVAESGAEDGAGAQVRVDEPWAGYKLMHADDVIDRITGASAAELGTVELYELSSRRRKTVLDAVQSEFRRSGQRG